MIGAKIIVDYNQFAGHWPQYLTNAAGLWLFGWYFFKDRYIKVIFSHHCREGAYLVTASFEDHQSLVDTVN